MKNRPWYLDDRTVVNENVLLLKTLRGQGGHSEEEFMATISEETTPQNAPVVVHALVELSRLDVVLKLAASAKRHDLDFRCAIWRVLGEKLRREPHRFTDADLDAIDALRSREMKRIPRYDSGPFLF